jgi:hypothetical protein
MTCIHPAQHGKSSPTSCRLFGLWRRPDRILMIGL